MPIIHTQVKKSSDIVFTWKGLPINKEMTIEEFFYQIVKRQLDKKLHSLKFEVKFGNSKNNITESASIECNAFEAITFYGPYCVIYLKSVENTEYTEEEEEEEEEFIEVELDDHQIKGDVTNTTKSRQIEPISQTRRIEEEKEERVVIEMEKEKEKGEKIFQNKSTIATVKNAKNVGVVLQCSECAKWRVLYCKTELTESEGEKIGRILGNVKYKCGINLDGLTVKGRINGEDVSYLFSKVKVNNTLTCDSSMETTYYDCKLFDDICFDCGAEDETGGLKINNYFYCEVCSRISDKKRKLNNSKAKGIRNY